ncbi:hypothetical protein [Paraburkholderia sp. D1E]|uniref:hypothetical protein n=1 Tax=Paraburkholderia sp. D1E TaxID=3461398 RepID=UPI0040454B87
MTEHEYKARRFIPRVLEVAKIRYHNRTGCVIVTAKDLRAAFDACGFDGLLNANVLSDAIDTAGTQRIGGSPDTGRNYVFPGVKTRLEAVRTAARNIALAELAEERVRAADSRLIVKRTATRHGCVVHFDYPLPATHNRS